MSYIIKNMDSWSSMLPIFKSTVQAEVLSSVLMSSGPVTTSDLVAASGSPQPTVHREATRLVRSELLVASKIGRSTLYSANDSNPLVAPLRSLVAIASGPQSLLASALHSVAGVEYAAIFGSFASRASGIEGPTPRDIDLLIVGSPNRNDVYSSLAAIESSVRREINVTFISVERWERGEEEIVRRIKSSPTLSVVPR